MSFIVPDSVLEHQVCSSCKNYLSFPPIKVYRNGEIKCGRCSVANDGGTISIFDTVAQSVLFPCVNRFEECSELLRYTDVKEHEKNCVVSEKQCWNCLDYQGSLLSLVHHYKIMHPTDVLVTPKVTCNLDQEFSKCFLYWDYQRNVILILKVSWDMESLSESYNTTVKTDKRNLFKVPDNLIRIKYNRRLDSNELTITVPRCFSRATEEYKGRHYHKFYADMKVNLTYQIPNGYYISKCGKKMVFLYKSLHAACDFCENTFASSGYVRDVYRSGSCYVCGTCFIRGVTKSLKNNGDSLVKARYFDYDLLSFCCRFHCGCSYESGDLLSHEDHCISNTHRNISDDKFVQLQFGSTCANSLLSKENVIFDLTRLKKKGKIFVATRDNFKCVIDYDVDDTFGVCKFHVKHGYDTKTHYMCIHKWENQTYSEVSNDFSMKIRNVDGPSLFAVVMKKVQEDS